jgi:hypothetical protein
MALLISIITMAASIGNYFLWVQGSLPASAEIPSLLAEVVFVIISLVAIVKFKGARTAADHERRKYQIWTPQFGLVIISLVANVGVMVVIALNLFGIVSGF